MKKLLSTITLILMLGCHKSSGQEAHVFDVVVYGSTPAGITAAVAAAREGLSVVLISRSSHFGGMATGGLSYSDTGEIKLIGGIAKEFFARVGNKYGRSVSYAFEPHIAFSVFQAMVEEVGVTIFANHPLLSVEKNAGRITSIKARNGAIFEGKVFIDASYDADLMAAAKVSYTFGREAKAEHDESYAGFRTDNPIHQFSVKIPFDPENPPWGIYGKDTYQAGEGDKKIGAYNYRFCMTHVKENQVAIPEPTDYQSSRYDLLASYLQTKEKAVIHDVLRFLPIPGQKVDVNARGPFSTDYIGGNWDYPDASFEQKKEIAAEHLSYALGLLYFLNNDSRVPKPLQQELNRWALCKDEFTDNNNLPPQLYIREARRMLGMYVLNEADVRSNVYKKDSVGWGSYRIESHHVQRIIGKDGWVFNEGYLTKPATPYQIPYRSLLPKPDESTNLLVPVAISATHVAYSSMRMEPVYMILGQSSGLAAAMAIQQKISVQEVPVKELQSRLRAAGQVI